MTELYINDSIICLNENYSIKIKSENTYLTKSSKYTLSIDIPICRDNIKVLGNINRTDIDRKIVKYENAKLYANNQMILSGTAIVTNITRTKVVLQLLSGNASLNFRAKQSNIYIDELNLPLEHKFNDYDYYPPNIRNLSPENRIKRCFGEYGDTNCVAFPVNNTTTGVVLNNWSSYGNDFKISGSDKIAIQPYLCYLIKRIFLAIGYKIGRNEIEESARKNIFMVNSTEIVFDVFGQARVGYEAILPHWELVEFITQIENLLGVVFEINDQDNTVNILERNTYFSKSIVLEQIVDEYECEVENEDEDRDTIDGNVGYNLESPSAYDLISEDILKVAKYMDFETEDDMWAFFRTLPPMFNPVEIDLLRSYESYIFRCKNRMYIYIIESRDKMYPIEVNQLRPRLNNRDKTDLDIELKLIPGTMETGTASRGDINMGDNGGHDWTMEGWDGSILRLRNAGLPPVTNEQTTHNIRNLIEGKEELPKVEKKDSIELAYNDGVMQQLVNPDKGSINYPWPAIIDKTYAVPQTQRLFSFALNEINKPSMYHKDALLINRKIKYHFSYIDDVIQPNSIFIIKNKMYICESLELEITPKGLQKLKSGYFYPILKGG